MQVLWDVLDVGGYSPIRESVQPLIRSYPTGRRRKEAYSCRLQSGPAGRHIVRIVDITMYAVIPPGDAVDRCRVRRQNLTTANVTCQILQGLEKSAAPQYRIPPPAIIYRKGNACVVIGKTGVILHHFGNLHTKVAKEVSRHEAQ